MLPPTHTQRQLDAGHAMAAAAVILIATSAVGQPSRQMLYKAPTFTVRNTTNVRFSAPPPY